VGDAWPQTPVERKKPSSHSQKTPAWHRLDVRLVLGLFCVILLMAGFRIYKTSENKTYVTISTPTFVATGHQFSAKLPLNTLIIYKSLSGTGLDSVPELQYCSEEAGQVLYAVSELDFNTAIAAQSYIEQSHPPYTKQGDKWSSHGSQRILDADQYTTACTPHPSNSAFWNSAIYVSTMQVSGNHVYVSSVFSDINPIPGGAAFIKSVKIPRNPKLPLKDLLISRWGVTMAPSIIGLYNNLNLIRDNLNSHNIHYASLECAAVQSRLSTLTAAGEDNPPKPLGHEWAALLSMIQRETDLCMSYSAHQETSKLKALSPAIYRITSVFGPFAAHLGII